MATSIDDGGLSELSFLFPHSGAGQSVLVRSHPNQWLVLDSNRAAGGQNPTVALLNRASKEPEFELAGILLSHFHLDHFGGLLDLLNFWREHCSPPDGERLPVILPFEYEVLKVYMEAGRQERGYLGTLLASLDSPEIPIDKRELDGLRFAHRSPGAKADPQNERWLFCFHPRHRELLRDQQYDLLARFRGWARRGVKVMRRKAVHPDSVFQNRRNRYSCVLGAGCGRESRGIHLLLTSDIPRVAFREMTEIVAVELSRTGVGENYELAELSRDTPHGRRVHAVDGLSVPHHGSRHGHLRSQELRWWLDGEAPSFAIVQGHEYALGEETVTELHAAGMRIFTSAEPRRLTDPSGRVSAVGGRLSQRPDASASSDGPYERDDAPPDPAVVSASFKISHLALEGGPDGVRRVVSRGFWEVLPSERKVVRHPASVLYRSPDATTAN